MAGFGGFGGLAPRRFWVSRSFSPKKRRQKAKPSAAKDEDTPTNTANEGNATRDPTKRRNTKPTQKTPSGNRKTDKPPKTPTKETGEDGKTRPPTTAATKGRRQPKTTEQKTPTPKGKPTPKSPTATTPKRRRQNGNRKRHEEKQPQHGTQHNKHPQHAEKTRQANATSARARTSTTHEGKPAAPTRKTKREAITFDQQAFLEGGWRRERTAHARPAIRRSLIRITIRIAQGGSG